MEENKELNLVEILKDCPKGMELDCTMYEEATLIHVLGGNAYPIKIETPDGKISLNKYGKYSNNKLAKCVIFPKGKTTWEGFIPPCQFKDGDILCSSRTSQPFILNFFDLLNDNIHSYCGIDCSNNFHKGSNNWTYASTVRYATEEEKQKLFQAIKDNGYKWNVETKTLEKLEEEKPKWNPETLQPFDKVLVKEVECDKCWGGDLFLYQDKSSDYPYAGIRTTYKYCIPYNEETKHLLGTDQEAPEYYRL